MGGPGQGPVSDISHDLTQTTTTTEARSRTCLAVRPRVPVQSTFRLRHLFQLFNRTAQLDPQPLGHRRIRFDDITLECHDVAFLFVLMGAPLELEDAILEHGG